MRLQDAVLAATPFQIQTTDGTIHTLAGARDLARSIATAPLRYVLDDASVRLVSETAFDEASMVGQAVDLLRMPAERVWIEWSDRALLQMLHNAGHIVDPSTNRRARKIGILIDSDETGRRGEARVLWQGDDGEAECSPFIAQFDLDCPGFAANPETQDTVRHVHIRGLKALDPFFGRVRYRLEDSWERYYRTYSESREAFETAISDSLTRVAGDLPFAAAFLLVLSTRSAFEERSSELKKLNTKRGRSGQVPLLDHVEIRLNLSKADSGGAGSGGTHSGPRLHHVSGHLVRRGDTLYWRRAHLRGNPSRGAVLTKTVAVTAEPLIKAA